MRIKIVKNREADRAEMAWVWYIVKDQLARWVWFTEDELDYGYAPTQPAALVIAEVALEEIEAGTR